MAKNNPVENISQIMLALTKDEHDRIVKIINLIKK